MAKRHYNLNQTITKNPGFSLPITTNPAFKLDDSLAKRIGLLRSRSGNSFAKKIIIKIVKRNSTDNQSRKLMNRNSKSGFSADDLATQSSGSTEVKRNSRRKQSRKLVGRDSASVFSADNLSIRSSGRTVVKKNSSNDQSLKLMCENSGTTPKARERKHRGKSIEQNEKYSLTDLNEDVQIVAASSLMSYDSEVGII